MPKHRYSHYVYPVKGDRQPARFIALAVESREVESGRTAKIRTRRLSKWSVQVWSCTAGRAGKARLCSGRGVSGLWTLLRGPLSLPGETWLVCADATQTCGLIGIWERLTDGTLTWDRAGKESTDVDTPGPTHAAAGPLCLGDPPFVLAVKIRGRAGTLRIVDVRNYGFDADRTLGNLAGITASIAGGIRSIVFALAQRGLGSLQTTAASQSWYSFRRKYVRHKIHVHCRASVLGLERAALAGGRCECYRLGAVPGPIYQVDFSSHYCSILRDERLPVRLRYFGEGESAKLRQELGDGRGVVASVRVKTSLPHLPYRRDGLVLYPTGRFSTVLCGPDLQVALQSGEVGSIGPWATYDMEPAFREHATECLLLRALARRSGDRAAEAWAKALGVSLVGKLAQRGRHWIDVNRTVPRPWCECRWVGRFGGQSCPQCCLPRAWGQWSQHDGDGKRVNMRVLAGRIQREEDHGETKDSCPAIAAYVYALGRRRLWRAQLVAGRDECYYCDTDSIFTSSLGYKRLEQSGLVKNAIPGELRLVGVHEWMEIFGVRHYRLPCRTVCAGSPVQGNEDEYARTGKWRRRTAAESIVLGQSPSTEEVLERVERVSPYRHGVRGADGTVTPWEVDEWAT